MSNIKEDVHTLLVDLEDTLIRKNSDYGNSFDEQMDEYGLVALCIRLSDKLNRLKQLSKNTYDAQVNDESIEDTLKDLAGYATLGQRWIKNNKQVK